MEPFDQLMAELDPPMAIVTTVAASGDERAGCLVGFHSQAGMEPNALAIWLSKANRTYRLAVFADVFAVHFPDASQLELAELFGTRSGDDDDKFQHCDWRTGRSGVPLLDAVDHRIVARKRHVLDVGADHVCIVLDPIETEFGGGLEPLRLAAVSHLSPGHDADERPQPRSTRAADRQRLPRRS